VLSARCIKCGAGSAVDAVKAIRCRQCRLGRQCIIVQAVHCSQCRHCIARSVAVQSVRFGQCSRFGAGRLGSGMRAVQAVRFGECR
jgi:hypothetical protein